MRPVLFLALAPLVQESVPSRPPLPDAVAAAVSPDRLAATVERLALFGTRHTLSEAESDERGIGAARRWLLEELDGHGGRLEATLDPHEVELRGGAAADVVNVVAVLPGKMSEARDRHYYVLAHYDSRASNGGDAESDAPGANDDGSGTALVLELARVLAKTELDSTVVFLATAGEEQGLWGASRHLERVLAEGRDVRAALNNDIVGDPTGPPDASGAPRMARDLVRVFSEGLPASGLDERSVTALRRLSGENDSSSRQLSRFVARVAEVHETRVRPMPVHRPDRFLRGGDHTPFNEHGIAAVRFTEVHENYARQHQDVREEDGVSYGDLPEHVDAEYLADVTRLNGIALVHLANAPSVPGNARLSTRSLSNDTTLTWEPSPEPDVAGYEVLWRATTEPDWSHVLDAGTATEATVDLSKDDWFFGVRAYDREGYRSPVAFPAAGR